MSKEPWEQPSKAMHGTRNLESTPAAGTPLTGAQAGPRTLCSQHGALGSKDGLIAHDRQAESRPRPADHVIPSWKVTFTSHPKPAQGPRAHQLECLQGLAKISLALNVILLPQPAGLLRLQHTTPQPGCGKDPSSCKRVKLVSGKRPKAMCQGGGLLARLCLLHRVQAVEVSAATWPAKSDPPPQRTADATRQAGRQKQGVNKKQNTLSRFL
ncbi:uncharacterized protein LOC124092569 isoform X2 [Marmota monax]|uniref:uncharacterized protein LOC124092569 isoform X2 n=1 Tax=Marmota monax TaxID=9995 RepID=UPI001EAFEDA5|nr:uncharacterized protein LOC124092569 isoform X2 [Marmota monax]